VTFFPNRRSRDREIWHAITQLKEQTMTTQAEVDGITTEVQKVATDLTTVQATLQTEIDNLAAANPSVDLSWLKAAVEPLDAAVEALGNLQPLKPEPAPEA
jgi:copper chaperone CopZ